jgi:hypothetical protein
MLSFLQEAAHGGRPIVQLMAYALAHMGPTKSNIEYNPDAVPKVYTNSSVHTRLSLYTKASRLVHGPDYNPRNEEHLDVDLVIKIGQGKKHELFYIGDDILETGCTPPLDRLQAASMSSSAPISQRPTVMVTLQVSILSFIHHSLAFTFLSSALLEHWCQMLQAELQQLRAQHEAQQQGLLKFTQQLGKQQG